jgi:UDP-N-acetylglucosamine 2-epimerase (non-hydrolysing)
VLLREWPDIVLVVGDVNSTAACALVTAKVPSNAQKPRPLIAHVEAGLRSFDRTMPEECNRVVTDHLSDLLFATEESGLENLKKEGIPAEQVFFVGNTMIDSLLAFEDKADNSNILERLRLLSTDDGNGNRSLKDYALLTLHRPANVDYSETFLEILEGVQEVAALYPVIFPAHPRTQKKIQQHQLEPYFVFQSSEAQSGRNCSGAVITTIDPLGYLDFLCLMRHAALVITDSGGIQEETTCLGVPCVTVRENTERPITLTAGTNVLGGTRRDTIRAAIRRQLRRTHERSFPERWDGKAGARIVEILLQQRQLRSSTHWSDRVPDAHAHP